MLTFIAFIVSLSLIILLFVMKNYEVNHGKKIFLEDLFLKCDDLISKALTKIFIWWSHVSFKNTKLIFSWIIANIKRLVIAIKRRFDHKQSHFFSRRDHSSSKSKGSTSFFLKDVSDYKKSLRENKIK